MALYQQLPRAQYRTGWVLAQVGRCHFEVAEYGASIAAYKAVRELDPARLQGMEYYSTALWHTKQEMQLSYLAQEVVREDRLAPEAWIVVGNCFSLQKEHSMALKFFERASQVDARCAYAYTLAAHEHKATEDFDKVGVRGGLGSSSLSTASLYQHTHSPTRPPPTI